VVEWSKSDLSETRVVTASVREVGEDGEGNEEFLTHASRFECPRGSETFIVREPNHDSLLCMLLGLLYSTFVAASRERLLNSGRSCHD
jgi:hypothetical protein